MSHLLNVYSRTSGLRIDKPELYELYFPTPHEKYIVFTSSTGMPGKNYDHWDEVLPLIKKHLDYKIVQVGGKEDVAVPGVDLNLCGLTTLPHLFYIIKKSSLVLCGDTCALHIANSYDIPFVSVFGITDPKISGAYFEGKSPQIYLTPDDHQPTFNPNENPKQINKINPEKIVNAVLDIFQRPNTNHKTIYIGPKYKNGIIESVPNGVVNPHSVGNSPITIRYDLGGSEEIIFQQLSLGKCFLFSNKKINQIDTFLKLKQNLIQFIYIIDKNYDINFIKMLINKGVQLIFLTQENEEFINSIKIQFCNYGLIQQKRIDTELVEKIKKNNISNALFKTNKIIFSEGKCFLSEAHLKNSLPSENPNDRVTPIIDDDKFWIDLNHYLLFNNE
ncbi:MAG: glycosyltransferase family 9 protein [Richelia sp. RM2_1_2]|nr:glycosyltransferase family 9 protein [Richelia sp. RM2_1_2]